ncbi:hypothetical protein AMECASPLE_027857 [Ameca splendens]|uniref:Uncharacterized protein n=1 Tax=Ameca splendens TaxID=208324 RepID=A0ABV1A0U4_9TELE
MNQEHNRSMIQSKKNNNKRMSQNLNYEKHKKKPETKNQTTPNHNTTPSLRADTRRPQDSKIYPNKMGGGGLGRRAKNKNRVQAGDQEVVPSRHRVPAGDRTCTKDVEAN